MYKNSSNSTEVIKRLRKSTVLSVSQEFNQNRILKINEKQHPERFTPQVLTKFSSHVRTKAEISSRN